MQEASLYAATTSDTFGSMYRLTMDAVVARAVAANCEQPHQVLPLDHGFLDGIDHRLRFRLVRTQTRYCASPAPSKSRQSFTCAFTAGCATP